MSSGLRVLHSPRFAHFDLSGDRPSVKYSVAWSFDGWRAILHCLAALSAGAVGNPGFFAGRRVPDWVSNRRVPSVAVCGPV